MAVIKDPASLDPNTPPPQLTPKNFVKEVVFDPGIVFSVADVLLFAKTNPVGFIACLGATGIAATLKTLHLAQPKALASFPKIAGIAADSRTPLRASGLALLVVGGASITTGAFLPATAGFLLAVGNFRLAQSISDAMDAHKAAKLRKEQGIEEPVAVKKPATLQRMATLAVTRPDLYINAGFACAGLMAGGAALWVLPVVAVSFGVSIKNILQNKPEYIGHPKALTAAAGFSFAGIGFAESHGLIATAHTINATILADAERRVTPGGLKAIVKNTQDLIWKTVTFDWKQKPVTGDTSAHIPIPFTDHDLGEDIPHPVLSQPTQLTDSFTQKAAAADKPATAPVPEPTAANLNIKPQAGQPPVPGSSRRLRV